MPQAIAQLYATKCIQQDVWCHKPLPNCMQQSASNRMSGATSHCPTVCNKVHPTGCLVPQAIAQLYATKCIQQDVWCHKPLPNCMQQSASNRMSGATSHCPTVCNKVHPTGCLVPQAIAQLYATKCIQQDVWCHKPLPNCMQQSASNRMSGATSHCPTVCNKVHPTGCLVPQAIAQLYATKCIQQDVWCHRPLPNCMQQSASNRMSSATSHCPTVCNKVHPTGCLVPQAIAQLYATKCIQQDVWCHKPLPNCMQQSASNRMSGATSHCPTVCNKVHPTGCLVPQAIAQLYATKCIQQDV